MSSPISDATGYGAINYPISATAHRPPGVPSLLDSSLDPVKSRCKWFVVALTSDGHRRVCTRKDYQEVIREDILAGLLKAEDEVRVHTKRENGMWDDSTVSLRQFALQHQQLRVLYEPVWTHAARGAWWGFVVGVSLQLLDLLIVNAMTDPRVAICLGAALLAGFIPRFGQPIAMGILFILGLMGKVDLLAVFPALIVWAILAGLPGMTIGGAIGWVREQKLPRAPDAPAQGGAVIVKSLVLPLIGSLLAWGVFIFVVYPWALSVTGSSPFGMLTK